jgi:hypothetical protein
MSRQLRAISLISDSVQLWGDIDGGPVSADDWAMMTIFSMTITATSTKCVGCYYKWQQL